MFKRSILALLAAVSLASLTSCGGSEETDSSLIQIGVTGQGLILPVANSTCVDKLEGEGARSAAAPALFFSAFGLNWIPTDKGLFISYIKVTVESSSIKDGEFVTYLGNDEIDAMLGLSGSTIAINSAGNFKIVSNQTLNRGSNPKCNFVVGGIALANPTQRRPFTANVRIELLGQAVDANDNIEVVRKTFTTSANAVY